MTAAQRESMPPVECHPWCEDGDGHPDYFIRRDQACWSPSEYVEMALEDRFVDGGTSYAQRVGVLARQRPDEAGHVCLHLDGIKIGGPVPSPYDVLDHSLELTPDEALRLATVLIAAAKLVRVEVPTTG